MNTNHRKVFRNIVVAVAVGLMVSACATHQSSSSFRANEVGRAQTVEKGVVVSVRDVTIQGGNSTVGTVAGAALGGIAGSTLGSGTRANTAGAVAGAVAGGAAGNAIGGTSTTAGVEVTVTLDSGRTIAVVQPGTSNDFRAGDHVRVSSDGVTTRVSR